MSIKNIYAAEKASADSRSEKARQTFETNCAELDALGQELHADTDFLTHVGWAFEEQQQGFRLENKVAWIEPICFAPDGKYAVHHAYHSAKWSGKEWDISTIDDVKRAVARLMVKYG